MSKSDATSFFCSPQYRTIIPDRSQSHVIAAIHVSCSVEVWAFIPCVAILRPDTDELHWQQTETPDAFLRGLREQYAPPLAVVWESCADGESLRGVMISSSEGYPSAYRYFVVQEFGIPVKGAAGYRTATPEWSDTWISTS